MKGETINKLKKYVVFFYIYAFFGWIIDVSIVLFSDGHFENRGFLFETICPMYGVAALILILIAKTIRGKFGFMKRAVIATLLCTIHEYFTAVILSLFFHISWWDYSNQPFNFQGRICLAASILWGFVSIVFMEFIHPGIEKVLRKIAKHISIKLQNAIIITALASTTADCVISVVNYLK